MDNLIVGAIALVAGGLVGFLISRAIAAVKAESATSQLKSVLQECGALRQQVKEYAVAGAEAKADTRAANARADKATVDCQEAINKRDSLSTEFSTIQQEKAELSATVSALNEKIASKERELDRQKEWIAEHSQHLQALFTTTADRLFEERAEKFEKENKTQIEALLTPFKTQLSNFHNRVETIHTAQTDAQGELRGKIETLANAAVEVGSKADRLAMAMLGNVKHQGEWGQAQLTRLLEKAGFIEGTHFSNQYPGKNEENERRVADTVIRLPNEEALVIDAKVTLPSWLSFCESKTPEEREQSLQQMVASVKAHYLDLAKKDYAHVVGKGRTIPFTVMFMPIEPAGIEVLRAAPDLLNDARRKNVIILTPTSLFGMLQLVNSLWGFHDKQANALEIAEQGRLLLSKLNSFLGSFLAIGKSLDNAAENFANAKSQLSTGRGHVISVANRMASLGVEAPTKGGLRTLLDETHEEAGAEVIPISLLGGSEDRA